MAITDKKGINVTSGFKLISPAPIDARYVVEDETELQSIIDSGAVYKGLRVWVNSLNKVYIYNGSSFVVELNADTTNDWTISGYTTNFEYTWELNAFQTKTINNSTNKRNKTLFNIVSENYLEALSCKNKITVMAGVIEDAISHIKALESNGVGGGSGGITEQKVVEIIEENIGDIDAVLDEINGGGTVGGSSSEEVEIEFSISASATNGIYDLTQITSFTDWNKVKKGKLVVLGTSGMATASNIEVKLSSVMKMITQNTGEVSMLAMSSVIHTEDGSSGIVFQKISGDTTQIISSGTFFQMLSLWIATGTTTCTLIVTI